MFRRSSTTTVSSKSSARHTSDARIELRQPQSYPGLGNTGGNSPDAFRVVVVTIALFCRKVKGTDATLETFSEVTEEPGWRQEVLQYAAKTADGYWANESQGTHASIKKVRLDKLDAQDAPTVEDLD